MKTYQILTNLECNLRCSYCYENFNGRVQKIEDIKDFLLMCFKRDQGKDAEFSLDIIGGEPFLVPDLLRETFEFCNSEMSNYGFKKCFFEMSTNGTMLHTPKCRKLLEDFKDQIFLGISIDGHKEKHDRHRLTINGSGSFDKAVQGMKVAQEIGVKFINLKATYTKDTIHEYFTGFKTLLHLKPNLINMNFVFEEVFDHNDAIHISHEIMNCFEYMFSLPQEDWVQFTHIFESFKFLNLHNPLNLYSPKALEQNKCGSCTHMICLGFDRKVYGCNRFVSILKPEMQLGYLDDEGNYIHDNPNLMSCVSNAYQHAPSECQSCRFNNECSDCVAVAWDEGIDSKQLYSQRRQCGFTKAKALVKLWGEQFMKEKGIKYEKNTCCSCGHCH